MIVTIHSTIDFKNLNMQSSVHMIVSFGDTKFKVPDDETLLWEMFRSVGQSYPKAAC